MQCCINGKPVSLPAGTTLAAYLADAGIPEKGLVVERNGEVLDPTDWPSTVLGEADQVELIAFVTGG